jgi:F-type H+-transporting ATPase subunit b
MLINWFTVGAQIVNFVVLVWLLKRFLYKPILNAIEVREKRIAAELADADAKEADAIKERDDFQKKSKAFDEQRQVLLSKAQADAKAAGDRLLDDARKEAEARRAAQDNVLRNERARIGDEITRLATDEVFEIARKALADLATVSLEERMGEVFTRRLREMDGKSKSALADALIASPEPALVRSMFDIGDEQRAAIQNALNEVFSADVRVRFEVAPHVICGIEISANGQKIAWSIATYLASLQQKVGAVLEDQSAPAAIVANPTVAANPPAQEAPVLAEVR